MNALDQALRSIGAVAPRPSVGTGTSFFNPAVDRRPPIVSRVSSVPRTPSPPRGLTDHQRRELMVPGMVWYLATQQVRPFVHRNDVETCIRCEALFKKSWEEVIDDIGDKHLRASLINGVVDVLIEVARPHLATEMEVDILANEIWLADLLERGVLDLWEGSFFARGLEEFNASWLQYERNRRMFAAVEQPARTIAGQMRKGFEDRGYFLNNG